MSKYDILVDVIHSIKDDRQLFTAMKDILSMDSFTRNSMIDVFKNRISSKPDSEKILKFLELIRNDKVAAQAFEIVTNISNGKV